METAGGEMVMALRAIGDHKGSPLRDDSNHEGLPLRTLSAARCREPCDPANDVVAAMACPRRWRSGAPEARKGATIVVTEWRSLMETAGGETVMALRAIGDHKGSPLRGDGVHKGLPPRVCV
jgi:hypothetical protein